MVPNQDPRLFTLTCILSKVTSLMTVRKTPLPYVLWIFCRTNYRSTHLYPSQQQFLSSDNINLLEQDAVDLTFNKSLLFHAVADPLTTPATNSRSLNPLTNKDQFLKNLLRGLPLTKPPVMKKPFSHVSGSSPLTLPFLSFSWSPLLHVSTSRTTIYLSRTSFKVFLL